jgi:hypothetical protein
LFVDVERGFEIYVESGGIKAVWTVGDLEEEGPACIEGGGGGRGRLGGCRFEMAERGC